MEETRPDNENEKTSIHPLSMDFCETLKVFMVEVKLWLKGVNEMNLLKIGIFIPGERLPKRIPERRRKIVMYLSEGSKPTINKLIMSERKTILAAPRAISGVLIGHPIPPFAMDDTPTCLFLYMIMYCNLTE